MHLYPCVGLPKDCNGIISVIENVYGADVIFLYNF